MIQLIVLDVDGTLSDGSIIYQNNDQEIKAFNAKDGLGIAAWIKLGRKVAIITGRQSLIVERRAIELGVHYLRQNIQQKDKALQEIINDLGITPKEVAVIGDDLNDLSMLGMVEHSYAPNDAVAPIKKAVNTVLQTKGGRGAVREMIDDLIAKEHLEDEFYALFV